MNPGIAKRTLFSILPVTLVLFFLVACSSSGTGRTATSTYTVGGTVSGLSGTVVLQKNGGGTLNLSANGSFTFSARLNNEAAYSVTISAHPPGQTCTVTNGSGTIAAAIITNVRVACTHNAYTVGGTISGPGGATLVLQNNGGNDLTTDENGSFVFSAGLINRTAYSVTVSSQPGRHCTVTNGSGVINLANATNVQVDCVKDLDPPRAAILFPPAISMTEGAAVTVSGTASDKYSIAAVRVNGMGVQTSNGFANWKISVPLSKGLNTISVETEDKSSNRDLQAAGIIIKREDYFHGGGGDLSVDVGYNRALVLDRARRAIFAIDLFSGARSVFSDFGDDQSLCLTGIAVDGANNRALVTESCHHEIIAVDLATGARTVFSDNKNPKLYPYSSLSDIAIDAAHNRALVLDFEQKAIITVDLSTGNRALLSNNTTPNDLNPFDFPHKMAVDASNNRLLVIDQHLIGVIAVDLQTGARTILSDNTTPYTRNRFRMPHSITVDAAGSRALITDQRSVKSVDLSTGDSSVLSSVDWFKMADNRFIGPNGIVIDAANNRALIADRGRNSIIAMDLSTREQTILVQDTTPDDRYF
ncbi:MAG TPA: hypothetical protein VLL97_13315, partial [Acidobacteriota bacterium]|nr:hypothetical protein [Acidobacteriota bacterium]